MFCTKCGSQLPDNAAFCAACGTPTGVAPQTQPQPQTQAQPQYQAPQPQAQAQPQYQAPQQPTYAQQPYGSQPQPAYAVPQVMPPSQRKKQTGLIIGIAAVAVVLVIALIAGIAAATGAFKRAPALAPGAYSIIVSEEDYGDFELFNAYVTEDLNASITLDGYDLGFIQLEESDTTIDGCNVFEGSVVADETYTEDAIIQVPKNASKGDFTGLWYFAEHQGNINDMGGAVETTYYDYGIAVLVEADGTGIAFFIDGQQYLNPNDARAFIGDESFPFTWHQTGEGSIEGQFDYYGETVTFTATVPVAS